MKLFDITPDWQDICARNMHKGHVKYDLHAQLEHKCPMNTLFDHILDIAQDQLGYFSTGQVSADRQRLHDYVEGGRLESVMRGIYRVSHFPPHQDEELMIARLWSEEEGIISHGTALALYGLTDLLPHKIHFTVPTSWKKRRRRIPKSYQLHYADLQPEDIQWRGAIPITTLEQTLVDMIRQGLEPVILEQALREAMARGLAPKDLPLRLLKKLSRQASGKI